MADMLVTFERKGAVAWLTLTRPEAGNGMNVALLSDLGEAVRRCDADPAVRAVVLTGAGRFFCVGGDLSGMRDSAETALSIRTMTLHLHGAVACLARMRAPSIAAVNGPAAGAGFSLALACDFLIASETAQFASAYAAAGLSADGGQSWLLPRRVGPHRAKVMMLQGRKLSAAEALDWGIADQVVAPDALIATATQMAQGLASGPTAAFGRMKNLLADAECTSLETQLELEARGIAACVESQDAQEGIAAFMAKRKPVFQGC